MTVTKAVFTLCLLVCVQGTRANATPAHIVRGVVITSDGTVVPEFTVIVRHGSDKPELLTRKRFKNGEFTIGVQNGNKVQIRISSPLFISTRLDFDFKAANRPVDYCIVVLHRFRNEARLTHEGAYTVSTRTLQQKIPDAARDAYKKAVELHRDGKLEDALVEYGKALRAYPQYVEALSDLGTIFILYDKPDAALAFLRRAQEVDDRDPITNLNVAIALIQQADYDEAMKLLKKVLQSEPRMSLAQFYIAKIHCLQKHYDHAEESLRKVVDNDPGFLDAWLLLVEVSRQLKKNDVAREALTHVRQSISDGMVTKIIDEQLSTLGS